MFGSVGTTLQICFAILTLLQLKTQAADWITQKYSHRSKSLGLEELRSIAEAPLRVPFESLLDPILIPRVSGTPNIVKVKDFIVGELEKLNWDVETDKFEDQTPFGIKSFENIIATLNPDVPRRLTLACHHDSKYETKYTFLGATDSAVPCAMLLHLAHTLKDSLAAHKAHPANNVTLQFVFFDGEEAFVQWSERDSTYGSRHLAAKWEQTPFPPGQRQYNMLNRMDMLVLLDLIGAKNPQFLNFFQTTSHWYNQLVDIENGLKQNRLFTGPRSKNYFANRGSFGGVEDDHIPFLNRGVDILHLITTPFPSVWHTEADNRQALDFPTIENLNRVLRVFVSSYLHLPTNSGS